MCWTRALWAPLGWQQVPLPMPTCPAGPFQHHPHTGAGHPMGTALRLLLAVPSAPQCASCCAQSKAVPPSPTPQHRVPRNASSKTQGVGAKPRPSSEPRGNQAASLPATQPRDRGSMPRRTRPPEPNPGTPGLTCQQLPALCATLCPTPGFYGHTQPREGPGSLS